MVDPKDTVDCSGCDRTITVTNASRTEPMAAIDATTWQTLCCPHCGTRLKTVSVGE